MLTVTCSRCIINLKYDVTVWHSRIYLREMILKILGSNFVCCIVEIAIMERKKIYGYHGTTKENADKIIVEQAFQDSVKDNEWLGHGVYFFAYLGHAKWWVRAPRYHGIETSIVKAALEFTDEQLLDLDDPEQFLLVEDVIKEATRIATESGDLCYGADLEKMDESKKWNFVCNTIRNICPEIGIIIYTFPTKPRFYVIGYQQTQRQICVSDHSIIKEVEVV